MYMDIYNQLLFLSFISKKKIIDKIWGCKQKPVWSLLEKCHLWRSNTKKFKVVPAISLLHHINQKYIKLISENIKKSTAI